MANEDGIAKVTHQEISAMENQKAEVRHDGNKDVYRLVFGSDFDSDTAVL
jgi:hypothetical protein